jgi:tRNA-(ms[2]io[6]A)-hydroxylase
MYPINLGEISSDIDPVLRFLRCRTPDTWAKQAVEELDTLLADHASLELKAAQQAQRLIWKYGTGKADGLADAFRGRLTHRMSRLAREELRHFEQVVRIIASRSGQFVAVSPSRYAGALHELARSSEPGRLTDQLLIGAIIEARSCERFFSLLGALGTREPELAAYYASLLRSEARHFEDYLDLARGAGAADCEQRLNLFLARDTELVQSPDTEVRFHSGPLSDRPTAAHESSRSRAQFQARS